MWSKRLEQKARQYFLIALLLGALGSHLWTGKGNIQAQESESELSSFILNKAELNPPLRTPLEELRFSPDGNYILAQDGSTIYILNRNPFAVRFSIEAHDGLPARFSVDSQLLLIPTKIGVEGRTLADNKIKFQVTFSPDTACYQAGLSPDGQFYACLDEKLRLRVFNVFTQEQIYDYKYPYGGFYMAWPPPGPDWSLHDLPARIAPTFQFSLDSRYLIVGLWWEAGIALDLRTGTPINLVANVRTGLASRTLVFLAPNKVAYADQPALSRLTILSYPRGQTLSRLSVAGRPGPGRNPKYFLEYAQGSLEIHIVDASNGSIKTVVSGERADVSSQGEVVSYEKNGKVSLSDLSKGAIIAQVVLPAGLLSDLRTTVVSPGFQSIAASVPEDGGIYDVKTGHLAARLDGFRGAWFQSDQTCYVEVPLTRGNTMEMLRLDADAVQGATVWKRNERSLNPVATGKIELLENALSGSVVLRSHIKPNGDDLRYPFRFHIDATDTTDGEHLWTRWNQYVVSAPFQDTQGDRVVLGSLAKEAKYERTVKQTLRKQRQQEGKVHLYAQDSYFEVLDGRSGKTVGGILNQRGAGPFQVDEAFSVGDWVVLVKDGTRVIVFSLSTGKEVMRSFGNYVTVSEDTGSLALTKDGFRVVFYNLSKGLQVGDVEFPRKVVYLHFSTDGKRLLVLSEDQSIYTLDVSSITAHNTLKAE